MQTLRTSAAVSIIALVFGPALVQAASLVTFGPGQDFTPGSSGVRGFEFTPLADLPVYALGVADAPSGDDPFVGDGLENPRRVGLWDAAGTLLVSVTVPQGAAGTLIDGFRYEPLGLPMTLAAGQMFILGVSYDREGDDHFYQDNGSSTLGVLGSGRITPPPNTAALEYPSNVSSSRIFGPNLSTTPVPEPSTLLLGLTGLLVTLCVRSRKLSVASSGAGRSEP